MGISSKDENPGYALARDRARALLVLTRQKPPVDVEAIIARAGVPVVERALGDDVRATVGNIAGQRSIVLNRNYQIRSAGERRWILAEELGHVLLEHRLVDSTVPGKQSIGLQQPMRVLSENEARAFAAELLTPFGEVRRRWFAMLRERPVSGELSAEDRVRRLASEFGVTPAAMRVRLQQMKMIHQSN